MATRCRYNNISEVEIGDKVLFDNTSGYIRSFPKIKIVGEVQLVGENDQIVVLFKIQGSEPLLVPIPYFLAQ